MSDDNWKQRAEQAELRIENLANGVRASQERGRRLERENNEWEQAWGTRGVERLKMLDHIEQLKRDVEGERLAREAAQHHCRDAEARLKEATDRNLRILERLNRAEQALMNNAKGRP